MVNALNESTAGVIVLQDDDRDIRSGEAIHRRREDLPSALTCGKSLSGRE